MTSLPSPEADTLEQQTAERAWVLTIPLSRPLSLNDRPHWAARAAAVRLVRQSTGDAARSAGIPALRRVTIEVHYVPRDSRRRDRINLAPTVKAIEDGIVDAKVVPDDTDEWVVPTHAVIDEAEPKRAGSRVYAIIREVLS